MIRIIIMLSGAILLRVATTVGVSALPADAAVEVEGMFEVD
jgi:hypothetical protein